MNLNEKELLEQYTCGFCSHCIECINVKEELANMKTYIDNIINIFLKVDKEHESIIPFDEFISENAFPLRLSINVVNGVINNPSTKIIKD